MAGPPASDPTRARPITRQSLLWSFRLDEPRLPQICAGVGGAPCLLPVYVLEALPAPPTLNHRVPLLAPHAGHTESKDSSCTFHLFLGHQVGKVLPATVPGTSTPSAMAESRPLARSETLFFLRSNYGEIYTATYILYIRLILNHILSAQFRVEYITLSCNQFPELSHLAKVYLLT